MKDFLQIFRRNECYVVVDLGTEVVKAVGFKRGAGRLSSVRYAKEYYTPHDVGQGGFKEVFDAGLIIEKTVKKACGGRFPLHCEVILGPLFVTPCLAHKKFIRTMPAIPITEEEEAMMHTGLQELCLDVYSLEHGAANGEEKPLFFENIFQEWSIDGYDEPHLIGQKGNSVEGTCLRMYASSSRTQVLEKLLRGIPKESVKFSYEFSYILDCIQLVSPGHRTVLCIDIGGRVTSLFLIQEGRVKEIQSRAQGSHDISEHLAKALGVGFFEAEKLKKEYGAGTLPLKEQFKIMEISMPLWDKFFSELLYTLSSRYENQSPHLISDIFFIGGGASWPNIVNLFKDAIAKQKTFPALGDFKVQTITPDSFLSPSSFKGVEKLFIGSQDTMCALALNRAER